MCGRRASIAASGDVAGAALVDGAVVVASAVVPAVVLATGGEDAAGGGVVVRSAVVALLAPQPASTTIRPTKSGVPRLKLTVRTAALRLREARFVHRA